MATRPKAHRIAALTAVLTSLAALGVWNNGRFAVPSPPIEPPSCDPSPPNVAKLGPALAVGHEPLPALNELGWSELRAKLRPGDKLYYFETQVSGGHLAMRGQCYLGQTNSWIR